LRPAAARLPKPKKAHDDLTAAAYRAQADALDIEAQAKRRLPCLPTRFSTDKRLSVERFRALLTVG
jgi:hypothetical protein